MNAYENDGTVAELTKAAVSRGNSILQAFKLDKDDKAHVNWLLEFMQPKPGAKILDAGCGIGEVARLMCEFRPDLKFTLLNISGAQLEMCPCHFKKVKADFASVPLPSHSFDVIMFNYSLGHGDVWTVLKEAARLMKPRGTLFIYDIETKNNKVLADTLGYHAHAADTVLAAANENGFEEIIMLQCLSKVATSDHMRDLMGDDAYEHAFKGVFPVLYKFWAHA